MKNELYKRFRAIEFEHVKSCKFEEEIRRFDFDGHSIKLYQEGGIYAKLTLRYCPCCGCDIDMSVQEKHIIKQRKKELIDASPIKLLDWVWIKKPNNSYWKGIGFKSQITSIEYQEHSDRLIYQNLIVGKGKFLLSTLDDIEPYTNQPIRNSKDFK